MKLYVVVNSTLISRKILEPFARTRNRTVDWKSRKECLLIYGQGRNVPNHPFNKGQGGSSRNEGLIVCVFSRCLLFFAPDIALFQHAWAPWRACNVAINRDYRCPIRLFYSISPRPYADRSRVIWTVKAGKGTAALAMEWKKGKRKRERGKGNGKKKKSGTYSRKVTFFEAATCFHRVSGSPARKMLGLATWLLKWRKYLTLAECILFMYLVQRCMHGHCFVCLSAND